MTIGILATGDEIIQGDTLNTNAQKIAHILYSERMELGLQLTCGDQEMTIADSIYFLAKHHKVVIIIGGLGPTSDDKTRFALGKFMGKKLVEYPEALAHIERRLAKANFQMNEGNRQQALFPPNSTLLPNFNGTAMGCYCSRKGKLFILLPGPPNECLPMFTQFALPILTNTLQKSQKTTLKWRLFGVAEGQIGELLDRALASVDCETGYRLEMPYVEFKVRCRQEQSHLIKSIIEPLVTAFIISPPEQKASALLNAYMSGLKKSIAIIDDATGGYLQTLLQTPESYKSLFFNKNGNAELSFKISGLDEYWQQKTATHSQLTIKYENKHQQGSETYPVPYHNNQKVISYAAEWLCFRLFHLINQLH